MDLIKRLNEKAAKNKRLFITIYYKTDGKPPRSKAHVGMRSARLIRDEFFGIHWRGNTQAKFSKVS